MLEHVWTFVKRLATIGVLVVEADIESGSIITANLAIKQGKKVWAVPGPITSKVSFGTNKLIKDGFAQMATNSQDILGKGIKIEQLEIPNLDPM